MRTKIILLSASMIGISLFISIWKNPPFDIILFFNTMFALSLLLSMIGAGLFLFQTDLFHPVIIAFRQLSKHLDKSKQMVEEVEQKKPPLPLRQLQRPLTRLFLFIGLFWLLITSLVSVIL